MSILGLALAIVLASSPGAAHAQASTPPLSEFVAQPDVIGDQWRLDTQADEPTLFRAGFHPPAVAGYRVTYALTDQVGASVALYRFPDHAGAVASLLDPGYYWGHGNTTFVPLAGPGDDQSFRAYGVGKGANSGVTFVNGSVVVYVRAEDQAAADTAGVDAICDSLAAAVSDLLEAAPRA